MIRTMRAADAPQVTAIIVSALGYDTDESVVAAQIEAMADDDHYLSLVFQDPTTGVVSGFVHAMRYETLHRPRGFDVISLAVSPEAQGTGIGTALIARTEREALARGGTYIRLNSRMERSAAHAFYEGAGYVADKVQRRFIKVLDPA